MAKKKAKKKKQSPAKRAGNTGRAKNETQASPLAPTIGNKAVLLTLGAMLALIFAVSFVYRLQNPSIKVVLDSGHDHGAPADGGMGPGMDTGGMGRVPELMRMMQEDPNNVAVLKELSTEFMKMDAFEEAEHFLSQAWMVEPGNTEVMNLLGYAQLRQGKAQEASAMFKEVISIHEHDAFARLYLGIAYLDLGDTDKARQEFEAVLTLETADESMKETARQGLQQLDQAGDTDDANATEEARPKTNESDAQ